MLTLDKDVYKIIDDVVMCYRITNVNAPVIVTFPPKKIELSDKEVQDKKKPWGFDFFVKQGINVISFNSRNQQCLYSSDEFLAFTNKLGRELMSFPERIGYGVSRGGFGVSLHADALKLDRVLLIMPVSTYDPQIAPWCSEVAEYQNTQSYGEEQYYDASKYGACLTIIYDPLSPADKKHAERYSDAAIRLRFFMGSHRIPDRLKQLGILKKVVMDFVNNKLNEDEFTY